MAVITATTRLQYGVFQVIITLDSLNQSQVFAMPRVTAMSLQVSGTFNASTTLDLQGSNDGTTYAALPTAVSLSAAGIKSVAVEDLGYRFYRAIILAEAPGSTLTVTVIGMEAS